LLSNTTVFFTVCLCPYLWYVAYVDDGWAKYRVMPQDGGVVI